VETVSSKIEKKREQKTLPVGNTHVLAVINMRKGGKTGGNKSVEIVEKGHNSERERGGT